MREYLTQYGASLADHGLEAVIDATYFLLQNPYAGPSLDYRDWRKWRPRRQRYVLLYRPIAEGIEVVRVRHERNDWKPVPE